MVTVPYQLSHLSTGRIPTENQSRSQQYAWPSNRSAVWCLYLLWKMVPLMSSFWFLVLEIDSNMENSIVSNKYKSWWYGLNHNRHNFNIEHLPFGMVYHYYQRSSYTITDCVFWITIPNIVIVTSNGSFLILCEEKRKKILSNNK